jgi:protein required for attachment to host cells
MDRKLVIVADAARAYFAVGEQRKLHRIILEMSNHELHTHEPDPKKNGRTTGGGGRHFYDPTTDNKDIESQAFVKEIVTALDHLMEEERYESLIVVAVPKMLGLIRKKLKPHWPLVRSLALEATQMSLEQLQEEIFD